jgi:elongation factor Ts
MTVADHVKEMVATIGENMSVRRTVAMSVGEGHVAEYTHNKVADGLGKIGVLVALESKGDKAALASFGRQLCLHIAAASPAAITVDDLDPKLIERERAIYTEQAKASGKVCRDCRQDGGRPPAQGFLPEGGAAAADLPRCRRRRQGDRRAGPQGAEKTAGAPIKIAKFARYALGEGIDRKDGDFASEVAKAAGKR